MDPLILWIEKQVIKIRELDKVNPVAAMHVWESVWNGWTAVLQDSIEAHLVLEDPGGELWGVVRSLADVRPKGVA